MMSSLSDRYRGPYVVYVLATLLYLVLVLYTVPQHGTSFDEQTDLFIAQSYAADSGGVLRGSPLDAINVRLPMYVSGLLLPLTDGHPIHGSRFVSCLFGVLTLLGVFVYGVRELNAAKGALACLLLATSPYFLAFSKVAMTEGDVFVTCFVVWSLVGLAGIRRSPRLGWAALTGVFVGLAWSSKISALALLPAAAVLLYGARARRQTTVPRPVRVSYALLAAGGLAVALGWAYAGAQSVADLPAAYAAKPLAAAIVHYALVCLAWGTALGVAYRHRRCEIGARAQLTLVCGFALTTFFAVPPVHTTNPAVVTALWTAFSDSNSSFSWAFVAEAAAFHFLVILLKPSLPIGLALWVSVAVAVGQWRRRPELRPLVVVLGFYFLFLIFKMPWAQTYYMLPLFPILTLLLADLCIEFWPRYRLATSVAGIFAGAALAVDLARTYPDFHLNGYQWVGERYLAGRSTIGYRSIVQTPSDGVEQVWCWVLEHVPPGERLVFYLLSTHIVYRFLEQAPFVSRYGFRDDVSIDEANYVVTTINSDIKHGWGVENPRGTIYRPQYDAEKLKREFRKVYSVKRAFGIEVATVWYRKVPYRVDLDANISGFESKQAGLSAHPPLRDDARDSGGSN